MSIFAFILDTINGIDCPATCENKKTKGETLMEAKAEVLKVPEVAEILRIPRSRAYALVQAGEIPSFKIGEKSVRVSRRQLDAYMERTSEAVAG